MVFILKLGLEMWIVCHGIPLYWLWILTMIHVFHTRPRLPLSNSRWVLACRQDTDIKGGVSHQYTATQCCLMMPSTSCYLNQWWQRPLARVFVIIGSGNSRWVTACCLMISKLKPLPDSMLIFISYGQWGPCIPYKPRNHNLYIGIIIFLHIDNPQPTGYN